MSGCCLILRVKSQLNDLHKRIVAWNKLPWWVQNKTPHPFFISQASHDDTQGGGK